MGLKAYQGKGRPVIGKGKPLMNYSQPFKMGGQYGVTGTSGPDQPLSNDPSKRMDKLSAKHKDLYDHFEMGQTSEAEESKMYRLEDRMDKVGKRIKKKEKKSKPV